MCVVCSWCRHEAIGGGEKMEKANVRKLPLTQVSCHQSMVLGFNYLDLMVVRKIILKHVHSSHSKTSSGMVLGLGLRLYGTTGSSPTSFSRTLSSNCSFLSSSAASSSPRPGTITQGMFTWFLLSFVFAIVHVCLLLPHKVQEEREAAA